MRVAVVILNWNGKKFLEEFLPILIKHTGSTTAEIIVADNASSDDSIAFLRANYPSVRQIVLDKNYGFAGGYNRALSFVEAEYHVLLNSDVEVTGGWLDTLLNYMEQHPEVAACQPKIRSYSHRNYFEHAGAAGGFIDYLGYPFCRGRLLNAVEEDQGQYDSVTEIFWATGACLLIRAESFKNAGGFDEYFFAHMEEIDLCWRLKSRGNSIRYIPESIVYHVGGGTLNAENPHKTFLNFRNNLLTLYKNLPQKQLRKILFYRYFLDYFAAFQWLLSGRRKDVKAVFHARKEYKKVRSDFKPLREENLKKTTTEEIPEVYAKSLVLQYYLKGKKTFTALGFNPRLSQ